MGDIYHAGEVYAGSVPIDDTQASEDTVYSSAKTEELRTKKVVKTITSANQNTWLDEPGVTSLMEVTHFVIATPSAVSSDITVTTGSNQIKIAGTFTSTGTVITLYLDTPATSS